MESSIETLHHFLFLHIENMETKKNLICLSENIFFLIFRKKKLRFCFQKIGKCIYIVFLPFDLVELVV